MKTLRLRADANHPDCADLRVAADILRDGGTVAFATETVYGLGANALDPAAVEKIFAAKQRPAWDPLIVHIAQAGMISQLAESVPQAAQAWISQFWPGPLTLLVPRARTVPDAVTAGRLKVGVRMPAHPVALALLKAAGVPIAAPSANTFGHVSPTTANHVAADLDGRIDAILDSGTATCGVESTVVDASVEPCIVYRPGAITLDHLRVVWPNTKALDDNPDRAQGEKCVALPAPGLGMRHYAPRARVILVEPNPGAILTDAALLQAVGQARRSEMNVGVMLPEGLMRERDAAGMAAVIYRWGTWTDGASLAQSLYAGLRQLDSEGVEVILCPVPPPVGVGGAIVDRLRKAARERDA